jgi:mono/diheme cytochrome c family protein
MQGCQAHRRPGLGLFLFGFVISSTLGHAQDAAAPEVDFNRDIRPILSDRCYACHGPDANTRQADLRLDLKEGALGKSGDKHIVLPSHPGESLLISRITAAKLSDRMPPAESGRSLSPEEIALLRRWVATGAQWAPHWSFLPLTPPQLPDVADGAWPRNAIDYFTLERLEAEGLRPSVEASKETLIRRVSLDLTGLPPTLAGIDAFLADDSPNAYQKVVERLLGSVHYGEQMALDWLDAARYADSHGYFDDTLREMWPWRDWVVEAFNRNMPFDEFTIWQVAGDMLPDATREQRIASGFNRNNCFNCESGIIAEEYRLEYVAERVSTISTVFLGLTAECARCHDHKFDPISTAEYYQLFAFFNNITEPGWWPRFAGNVPPVLELPSEQQTEAATALDRDIAEITARFTEAEPALDAAQAEWEKTLRTQWHTPRPLQITSESGAEFEVLADDSIFVSGKNVPTDVYRLEIPTPGSKITAVKLEALAHPTLPQHGPGRSEKGNAIVSGIEVVEASRGDVARGNSEKKEPLAFRYAFTGSVGDGSARNFGRHLAHHAIDGKADTGWGVRGGKELAVWEAVFVPEKVQDIPAGAILSVRLRQDSPYAQHTLGRFRVSFSDNPALIPRNDARLGEWYEAGPYTTEEVDIFKAKLPPEAWIHESTGLPGSGGAWVTRPHYTDREIHALDTPEEGAMYLYRTVESPGPRELVLVVGSDDGIRLWLNGKLILEEDVQRKAYLDPRGTDRAGGERVTLKPGLNHLLLKIVNRGQESGFYFDTRAAVSDLPLPGILAAVGRPLEDRTEEETGFLRKTYRRHVWEGRLVVARELSQLESERSKLADEITSVMIMEERDELRETFVLTRGQHDAPGERVAADVPACLPPLQKTSGRKTRLDLARWLVDPDHPLTARVTVNRLWQKFFGTALVKTSEDFGIQGERPSHPELLDWLAYELSHTGWDLKDLQRRIVLSATYRQASHASPELTARDPANRLLARGPRVRFHVENLRDNALAISGLLVPRVGGPSVYPYQAPGLWKELTEKERYVKGEGEDLYRRTIYSHRRRSIPTPNMATFDAPERESCVVRRTRTNTPLQALVLMNNPIYMEASKAFAQRIMKEAAAPPARRIAHGFRLATARWPLPEELAVLVGVYEQQVQRFEVDGEAARAVLSIGDFTDDESLDATELAAYTLVANMLLNLDEAITKG